MNTTRSAANKGMRILVAGARGMLGTDLVCVLEEKGHEVFATDVEELDITQPDFLARMIGDICPDVVVNCAAYTNVDRAEEEPERAFRINGLGAKNLSLVCEDHDIELCHISTDYVFDGTKEGPYLPDDPPNPINAYGRSKLAGEESIREIMNKYYIIRTSWLYGRYGKNFVYTILDLAKKQRELRIVSDQIGSPTWTGTLARVISVVIGTKKYGLYHVTDRTDGGVSWFEFAREIVRIFGIKADVVPVRSGDCSLLAKRPQNSVLDLISTESTLKVEMPSWKESLKGFFQTVN